MQVKCEPYGTKIGVDNNITEALINGKWGIRLDFTDEENTSKFSVVLTEDQAEALVGNIDLAIKSICKVKLGQKLPRMESRTCL